MVAWPATFKCNQNCLSCILNTRITSTIPDPSLVQVKNIIDELDPKNEILEIGGGEPTLRRELFDVLRYVKETKPDLYVFLVSNGRMFFYEKYVKKLAEISLSRFRIGVAFYGHTPEIHDFITQTRGSFKETVRGVINLLKYNIPVELRFIISRLNYKYLPDFGEFSSKKFNNVERFVLINMKYTGNAFLHKNILFVKISDVVPYATETVDIFWSANRDVRLFHFPLCILPEGYRKIAEGITKEEEELVFAPQCSECKLKSRCPRIWKTYAVLAGFDEFKPFK